MQFILNLRYSATLLLVLALAGCIEENPNLVNPPPQTETVQVRFINLSSDKAAKKLSLDNMASSDLTIYGRASKTFKPPVDSSNLLILSDNGTLLQKTKYKMRFIRETYYTVFYMPLKGDTVSTSTDTLFMISTLSGLVKKSKTSYIKLFNAVDDLNATYSLNLGCPSGKALATGISYGRYGIMEEVRSDTVAVSLTKFKNGADPESKLFKFYLKEGFQYTIITAKNEFGDEKAYLLSDEDLTENALKELETVNQRNTFIRVANFSKKSISIKKEPDFQIINNAQPGWISEFIDFEVCKTTAKDFVGSYIDSVKKSSDSTSFEVLEKYTAFIFDNDINDAGLTVLAGPVYLSDTSKGRAVVRVINAAYKPGNKSITLSVGAHENTTKTSLYSTGEYIATNLQYRTISEARLLSAGFAPLTLFTSTNPGKLLTTALTQLEAGHKYIIVVTNDDEGNAKLSIIDEDTGPMQLEFLPQAVFVQIVNATTNSGSVSVTTNPVLLNAVLPISGSLATVINAGQSEINAGGSTLGFESDKSYRYLFVAGGSTSSPDNFIVKTAIADTPLNNYLRRVINASPSIQGLTVRQDIDTGNTVVSGAVALGYKQNTEYEPYGNERKNSILFIDANTTDPKTGRPLILLRVDDISYSFGKNYSIIFCGAKAGRDYNNDGYDDGYYSIILQEF